MNKEHELERQQDFSEYKKSSITIQTDSPCVGFIKANKHIYIVCRNSIYLLETGIEKDLENKFPFSPNTTQKILDKGTDNHIIRQIYEYISAIENGDFEEYQCFTLTPGINKEKVKTILLELLINMSTFEDSYNEFRNSNNTQLKNTTSPRCGNNFELQAFIPNLEKIVKNIIVTEIGGLLNKLTLFILEMYGINLSNNKKREILNRDKRLDKTFEILQKQELLLNDADSVKFIQEQCKDFLSYLIDIRNAMEHRSSINMLI